MSVILWALCILFGMHSAASVALCHKDTATISFNTDPVKENLGTFGVSAIFFSATFAKAWGLI